MKVSLAKTLLDSITQFGSLSSSNTVKAELVKQYYLKTEEILKNLKPVFEEVISELASDEELDVVLKELDAFINETRELMEKWPQMMSKIYFVIQIESALSKLLTSALETCQLVNASLSDNSSPLCVENSMKEIQQIHCGQTSYIIKEVVRAQLENTAPRSEHLEEISKKLSLLSNIELLMEAAALNKLKTKVRSSENHAEVEEINQMITLVNYMHVCHVEINQLKSINGVPISDDFCCPLSLELMSDPVIVASGQTYERAFIKQWLDDGYNVCPKTCQTLTNTSLVTNYNVKDLIVNWCESNGIAPPDTIKYTKMELPAVFRSLSDSSTNDITISHSSRSPRGDHPRSPNMPIEDSISSDGVHQGTRLHGQSTSPHNPISLGSPLHIANDAAGEVSEDGSTVSSSQIERESEPMVAEARSRSQTIWRRPSKSFIPRINQTMESGPGLSAVEKQVRMLIEDLKSDTVDVHRAASAELRLLARPNMENRIIIANCGGIELLVRLLHSTDPQTQENSVTALLNLSINDNNKIAIANADAINPLIHVLETGNPDAKENAAATLLSLSVIDENKARIGRSRGIKPLVELLGNGTPRGKKDAASALFNLSTFHGNKAQIVEAGAVKHLVELMDPAAGMVDKVVPVLANLSTIQEGRTSIGNEGGIPFLVNIVEVGSARAKEHAAAALLQLCMNNNRFCSQVLREGAGPPLVVLSITGTARAKEKAQNLLSHFRNLRHGNVGRP